MNHLAGLLKRYARFGFKNNHSKFPIGVISGYIYSEYCIAFQWL